MKAELCNYDTVESGKRLKAEAKQRGLTCADMADILGYANEKQISPIYSAKAGLHDDLLEILASKFGYRVDYLKALDDWKTEKDMLEYADIQDRKAFDVAISYIRSLGYDLKPVLKSRITVSILYRYWDQLAPHITDSSKEIIEKMYDFNELDFLKHHWIDQIDIVWKSSPYFVTPEVGKKKGVDLSSAGKTVIGFTSTKDLTSAWTKPDDLSSYNLVFEFSYHLYDENGEYVDEYSVKKIQNLIRVMDSYSQCTIKHFLFDV